MGNASKRGTFEQRKAAAIARDKAAMIEAERQRIDRERALTPEERERRHKERMSMAHIMGLAAMFRGYGRR
jgi:hypothetical protein